VAAKMEGSRDLNMEPSIQVGPVDSAFVQCGVPNSTGSTEFNGEYLDRPGTNNRLSSEQSAGKYNLRTLK
jgi:hypothetical protein